MFQLALAAILVLASAPASAEPAMTGADANILRSAVASAGGYATGGGISMTYSLGENTVAVSAGGAYSADTGVVPLLSQPGTVTSIVAVSKSTGTLDLTWTAPGRDGLLGDVTGGFYRIDYSSDVLHVFAPTTFSVEFATNVVPGAAQAYRLTGLEPNTTYYARVYLADERKFVAEQSAPSANSTLANVPIAPTFTGVFATSVTISWLVPAGGAAGYDALASSTNFGGLFPGGAVVTSNTANGLAVTLTVKGLSTSTSYFFKLGSLNWQSDFNYEAVLTTRTKQGGAFPIENLLVSADNLNRTVSLTWTNPASPDPAGVTVLVSTMPITFTPVDGAAYPPGTIVADGSVVRSSVPTPGAAFSENGLQLNVTAYFALFSRDSQNSYSVGVSTLVVLDLPPMACAGFHGDVAPDGSSITLRWSAIQSNMDGALFRGSSPIPWELDHFTIWRSTGIMRPTWVFVGTAPANALSYGAMIPVAGGLYFYKVVAHDAFTSSWTDQAMIVDTYGALYALGGDGVSRMRLGPLSAGVVKPAGNRWGQPLLMRAKDRPQDLGGRVVKSVDFESVIAPTNQAAPFMLNGPDAGVTLRFEMAGGQVMPSGANGVVPAATLVPAITAATAPERLSAYVVGSNDSAKVFGRVDTVNQTLSLDSSFAGNYQIRTVSRPAGFSFDVSGVSNKALTPNGDGLNDTVVFTFANDNDSEVTGKIFDLRGSFVSDMTVGPVSGTSLKWDARASGTVVSQGVYLYQIRAEGKNYTGTVVVVR